MPELDSTPPAVLPDERARTLLRKLRDLNLTAFPLELAGGRRLSIEGCLSLDRPVENELCYLLRRADGGSLELGIAWREGSLSLSLTDPSGDTPEKGRRVRLLHDCAGRASSPELRARMDPDSTDPREVEHFLRRVVRGACAA